MLGNSLLGIGLQCYCMMVLRHTTDIFSLNFIQYYATNVKVLTVLTVLSVLSIITTRREQNVSVDKTFTCKLRDLYLVKNSFIYL